jgi:hypothetical protein
MISLLGASVGAAPLSVVCGASLVAGKAGAVCPSAANDGVATHRAIAARAKRDVVPRSVKLTMS